MHTLVTHIRPHLDDICAFWLLKRYLPEAKEAEIGFIATDEKGGKTSADPETVYVGVGRGKFDEHKGDVGECATTLVFAHVKKNAAIDPRELRALQKIVDWVLLEDTGRLSSLAFRSFAVPAILEGFFDGNGKDSAAMTEFGFVLLDAIMVMQRNEVAIDDMWEKRIEFDSRYGRTVALVGSARQIDWYAYAKGFPLVVIMDPDRTYHTIRADAATDIDLTPAWENLRKVDPGASWYFHHSKKMLICGGDHAPGARPSTLDIDGLIAALK